MVEHCQHCNDFYYCLVILQLHRGKGGEGGWGGGWGGGGGASHNIVT